MTDPTFYFDVGSPYAYLTAERIDEVLPEPVTWQPISLGGLFKLGGRSSWAVGDAERRTAGMAEVQRRARAYGLPPLRWPDPWPSNYLFAMRALTFALAAGCGRELALRAFRAAFVEGCDLAEPEHVLDAAASVGLDRRQVADATADPEVKLALRAATDAAHARGVIGVPTIALTRPSSGEVANAGASRGEGPRGEGSRGDELYWGDDRLEDAAAALGA